MWLWLSASVSRQTNRSRKTATARRAAVTRLVCVHLEFPICFSLDSAPIAVTPKEKQEMITKAYENPSTTKVAEDSWSFLPAIKTQQAKISRRRQVKDFVEHVICRGPRGLIEEFRKMKRTNDLTKMTEFVAQIHKGKNRYKDVGCLDNNRVVLTVGPCSYIHANYVSTPDNPKKFICTQAPLPDTCAEFWCMVVQESAEVIVMLCNFIEQVCEVMARSEKGERAVEE
ncbi:hypothetical protein Y032_0233g3078 [Ancylostoma ceylanicum]|uniref:Tyrosine-protein phosphatase domain-containing protein n=1 Tax=Ancylostoma ceylanicum TaxID=53326 RepID=A0A016SFW2_9BILA|nr:hypothetical protein Y032_0233g3078 [Ancylostoma ceylanicum]